jgi:hypothetical protein
VTPLDRAVLENVRAGRLPVHDLGAGKTLARAQQSIVDLLGRGWVELSPLDTGPAFVLGARGAAALEPFTPLR